MNLSARLRGKVEQQVGELAGSANKVFTGVVDSGFSALRGFLGGDQNAAAQVVQPAPEDATKQSPRQGFGLLRRASGFSIASVAASLPVSRRIRSSSVGTSLAAEETGQQMIEVPSRPGSVRSGAADELSEDDTSSSQVDSDEESGSEEEEEVAAKSDVRSIRSFTSMMSEAREEGKQRKSLSDRLANVSRLGIAGSPSREGSLRKVCPNAFRLAEFNTMSFLVALSSTFKTGELIAVSPERPHCVDSRAAGSHTSGSTTDATFLRLRPERFETRGDPRAARGVSSHGKRVTSAGCF